jgi:hypothetical protein
MVAPVTAPIGAGSPTVSDLALEPDARRTMMDVVAIEKRHDDVDIEQRPHAASLLLFVAQAIDQVVGEVPHYGR